MNIKSSKLIRISTKPLAFRPQGFANIFIISAIIVSFCVGLDSATSNVSAARPLSLITGCPSLFKSLLFLFKKSTKRKAPLRLLPSLKGWFLMMKYS